MRTGGTPMTQETPICLQWRESTPESLCFFFFLVPIWRLQVFFSQKASTTLRMSADPRHPTRWCPSSLAHLVNITPITKLLMVVRSMVISMVHGDYKPTFNREVPPCSCWWSVWGPKKFRVQRSPAESSEVQRSSWAAVLVLVNKSKTALKSMMENCSLIVHLSLYRYNQNVENCGDVFVSFWYHCSILYPCPDLAIDIGDHWGSGW